MGLVMVKAIILKVLGIFIFLFLGEVHLARASKISLSSSVAVPLWTIKSKGAISYLAFAQKAHTLLIATSPDSDIEGSARFYFLTAYNDQGRELWSQKMQSPVKDLDLSGDGKFAVVSNYENELLAFDAQGKLLWKTEGTCKPYILSLNQKILCHHDDDAKPQIVFDVLDWNGKKTFSYSPTSNLGDALVMKVASDESQVALAFRQGQVEVLNQDFKKIGQAKVDGEIVDLAISKAKEPILAVLYGPPLVKGQKMTQKTTDDKQSVALFQSSGKEIAKGKLETQALQLEWSPAGDRLYHYGNSPQGQKFGQISLPSMKQLWIRGSEFPAVYSSAIAVGVAHVVVGFEETSTAGKNNHLLVFDSSGQQKQGIRLAADLGAHLYSFRASFGAGLCFVATDDGRLSAYGIKK